MALQVPPGRLWIRTIDRQPPVSVRCYLGETAPKVVDGYGGWTVVGRQRQRGLTEWTGNNPLAIEITFVMDGWADQESVEPDMRALERMAGVDAGVTQPPLVHWDANGMHDNHEASQNDWVIETLEWNEDISRNDDGETCRASGTFTLRQFVGDEFFVNAPTKKTAPKKSYVIKPGDTLMSIAKAKLGNSARWPEIQKLNSAKVRDPRHVKDGITITLPAK